MRELVAETGFPVTSTLMGLGAFPASDNKWLGMLGMHGTFEANWAMHDCDVMINIGARFDDRVTGRLDKFSPDSQKIHVDIDASSINKNVQVDIPIVSDATAALKAMLEVWRARKYKADEKSMKDWWTQIEKWRAQNCLAYKKDKKIIKPQYALERLRHYMAKDKRDVYVSTEVGQHQMWAAQFLPFDHPNRWMTSGGAGDDGLRPSCRHRRADGTS